MSLNIFITGATGYIGGAVLGGLLAHPERDTFIITALMRDAKKAERFQAEFGVKPVIGSLDDTKLVEDAAANADIVINAADADHIPGMKAILAGIERRYKTTRQVPVLIHTSGTGLFADDALGMNPTDVVYSDLNVPLIELLPDNAPHRAVDLLAIAADVLGYTYTYIVLPGIIYGNSTGFSESGLANRRSNALSWMTKQFAQLGRVGMIGVGKNVWPSVEVGDMADFYLLLFDNVRLRRQEVTHGREGYYIVESGEGEMSEFYRAIGVALEKRGKVESSEPQPLSDEEANAMFGPVKAVFGGNARAKGDRARMLGWKPKYTNTDFIASIDPEVDVVLDA